MISGDMFRKLFGFSEPKKEPRQQDKSAHDNFSSYVDPWYDLERQNRSVMQHFHRLFEGFFMPNRTVWDGWEDEFFRSPTPQRNESRESSSPIDNGKPQVYYQSFSKRFFRDSDGKLQEVTIEEDSSGKRREVRRERYPDGREVVTTVEPSSIPPSERSSGPIIWEVSSDATSDAGSGANYQVSTGSSRDSESSYTPSRTTTTRENERRSIPIVLSDERAPSDTSSTCSTCSGHPYCQSGSTISDNSSTLGGSTSSDFDHSNQQPQTRSIPIRMWNEQDQKRDGNSSVFSSSSSSSDRVSYPRMDSRFSDRESDDLSDWSAFEESAYDRGCRRNGFFPEDGRIRDTDWFDFLMQQQREAEREFDNWRRIFHGFGNEFMDRHDRLADHYFSPGPFSRRDERYGVAELPLPPRRHESESSKTELNDTRSHNGNGIFGSWGKLLEYPRICRSGSNTYFPLDSDQLYTPFKCDQFCCICRTVSPSLRVLQCGHSFCSGCWHKLIEFWDRKGEPFVCLVDKSRVDPRLALSGGPSEDEILNLEVRCKFQKFGCEKSGSFQEIVLDHQMICDVARTDCPSCGDFVEISEIFDHLFECLCVPKDLEVVEPELEDAHNVVEEVEAEI